MSAVTMESALSGQGIRKPLTIMFSILILANLAAWAWAFAAFHDKPVLLGTALLAWVLGLRHAVDPDHIAAIDNVTRKFLQTGARPVTTGLWFALGHSTVVIIACALIAMLAAGAKDGLENFREIGGLIGVSVSSAFLLAIGLVNLAIFMGVLKTFREVRLTGRYREEDLDSLMNRHGFLARILRPLFKLVRKPWHMYPLGFLFGLGFDTATEIGLFAMAAATSSEGVSLMSVMIFPALFTAGMALADAADGAIMLGAYEWAKTNPVRKLFYNLTITGASVFVALVIGSIQALGALAEKFKLSGVFWDRINGMKEQFEFLGFMIVAFFVLAWLISAVVYRFGGYSSLKIEREA